MVRELFWEEETSGQTHNMLEGLHILSGLGTSQEALEEMSGEKGIWANLFSKAATLPESWMSRVDFNRWMAE